MKPVQVLRRVSDIKVTPPDRARRHRTCAAAAAPRRSGEPPWRDLARADEVLELQDLGREGARRLRGRRRRAGRRTARTTPAAPPTADPPWSAFAQLLDELEDLSRPPAPPARPLARPADAGLPDRVTARRRDCPLLDVSRCYRCRMAPKPPDTCSADALADSTAVAATGSPSRARRQSPDTAPPAARRGRGARHRPRAGRRRRGAAGQDRRSSTTPAGSYDRRRRTSAAASSTARAIAASRSPSRSAAAA